jgi:DNA-binding response OmpR family regulator
MARILLLEPDQVLAEAYRQALQQQGHSVVLSSYLYKPLTSLKELTEAVDAELALVGK